MIGDALADQPSPHFGLWLENEVALDVLIAMRTQLRYAGLSGAVAGLDYSVLPWVMQQLGVAADETASVFFRVQWAEAELVAHCNKS